jgi:hypothetical protein
MPSVNNIVILAGSMGPGRMLKKSASTRKVQVQAKIEQR